MDGSNGNGGSGNGQIKLRGIHGNNEEFWWDGDRPTSTRKAADRVIEEFNIMVTARLLAHIARDALPQQDITLPR